MNILFATLIDINSITERGIYQDLMREISALGHNVYIISPAERRQGRRTCFIDEGTGGILKVRVGNIQKTNRIEKGISTLLLESQYLSAVKKYLGDVRVDLIIYSTPPITLVKVIKYIKKRDKAKSYLLLKDIFPQNAVDMGLLSKSGLLYRFFRRKEKALYKISDHIGCMSPANVEYLLKHNDFLNRERVHVNPNSITPLPVNKVNRADIREKYKIPHDSKVFIYGGNLGKPQCVQFITEFLRLNKNKADRFFIICGEGTDAYILERFIEAEKPGNIVLLKMLPKDDYDDILSACDFGLIFLDHRFTIPNFPSRVLSYMEHSLPVLACTDPNTDIGEIIETNGFGRHCESDDPQQFQALIDNIVELDTEQATKAGEKGRYYLEANYLAAESANIILNIEESKHV